MARSSSPTATPCDPVNGQTYSQSLVDYSRALRKSCRLLVAASRAYREQCALLQAQSDRAARQSWEIVQAD